MNDSSSGKAGWQIAEWCNDTGVGRTRVYEFMNAGMIKFVKVGARTIITTSPDEFLAYFADKQAQNVSQLSVSVAANEEGV